jgi:glycosyltransferase involved in cell wall biosynthesis
MHRRSAASSTTSPIWQTSCVHVAHDAHVVTTTRGAAACDGTIHRLDLATLPRRNVVGDARALGRVRALLETERFDIVHAHSFQSPLAHIAMLAARQLAIPGVLTQHTRLAPSAAAWLRWTNRCVGWAAWPTRITAVSSVVSEQLGELTGRDDHVVVHPGIELRDWTRRHPPSTTETVITCVTRMFRHKHPDEFVRAIPRVLEVARTRPLRFVMVGYGPERERLERLARRLEVIVQFVGPLPHRSDVAAMVARSHIAVVPNPNEAFPSALLEARALGVPVVACRASGARDIITDGEHGLLCGTTDDIGLAIARLCDDPALRASLAARTSVGLERFGWDAAVERHLALYRELAGSYVRHSSGTPAITVGA